jgi:mannosyltransferase OCH1-like enzyme
MQKVDKTGKISPNVYQTWLTKDLKPGMKECVEYNKSKNPKIKFHLFDDEDCKTFLEQYFVPEVANTYEKLIPGAYKADLWRYCVLYKHGGIYMDIKFKFADNIDVYSMFVQENQEVFVEDSEHPRKGIYNAFMICRPGNQKMLYCINKIIENVNNKYFGEDPLYPTGPMLLKSAFSEEELNRIEYKNKNVHINSDGMTNVNIENKNTNQTIVECYKEYRQEQINQTKVAYYHDLWNAHDIYKD